MDARNFDSYGATEVAANELNIQENVIKGQSEVSENNLAKLNTSG